jgi:hypothetical protein
MTSPSSPISEFTSHIDGRNATVSIYPDRIEWRKRSLVGRGDTNMIPVRQIQGVTTQRSGLLYTLVRAKAGSDTIGFRVGKAQAAAIRATIADLIV